MLLAEKICVNQREKKDEFTQIIADEKTQMDAKDQRNLREKNQRRSARKKTISRRNSQIEYADERRGLMLLAEKIRVDQREKEKDIFHADGRRENQCKSPERNKKYSDIIS